MTEGDKRIRKFFGDKKGLFTLDLMETNGDCFYQAVSENLRREVPKAYISDLRKTVAAAVTRDTVDSYLTLSQVDGEIGNEYAFMKKGNILTVADLQVALTRTAGDVGVHGCIWADDFAIQAISNRFNLTFLIINDNHRNRKWREKTAVIEPMAVEPEEETKQKEAQEGRLKPENESDERENEPVNKKFKVEKSWREKMLDSLPDYAERLTLPPQLMLLARTSWSHYNLVRLRGKALLIAGEDISADMLAHFPLTFHHDEGDQPPALVTV
jgi:hypothetical protein